MRVCRRFRTISMGAGGAVLSIVTLVTLVAPERGVHICFDHDVIPPIDCTVNEIWQGFFFVDIAGT